MENTTQPNQFEARGYTLDPTRDGYQILYNYESTYWRALVGNDAWGLYEVLRSFCHRGSTICYPSISLLMSILGISDRRTLIGRQKEGQSSGGYLSALEDHGLVTIETKIQHGTPRHIFHVRLDPSLLTKEQVSQLPKALQRQHRRFLASHQPVGEKEPTGVESSHGGWNHPTGGVESSHPNNNNITIPKEQQELDIIEERINNNSSGGQGTKNDVVVALIDIGITERVAKRLASRYKEDRILEKIGYLEYLRELDPDRVKNPRGWLRSAIEEDYSAPDGYRSPEELEQERKAREKEEEELRKQQQQIEQERQRREEEQEREYLERLQALQDAYGAGANEEQVWTQVLEVMLPFASTRSQKSCLQKSALLEVEDRGEQALARIAVRSGCSFDSFGMEWNNLLSRTLAEKLGKRRVFPVFETV